MKILVIGSGGREHAICWKLSNEENVDIVYAAPGNPGISKICKCIDIGIDETEKLIDFSKKENIDLVVVGPELPLVNGIVDELESEGIKVFGPNKSCSRLEGSKVFAKDFMTRHGISTAKYSVFNEIEKAKKSLDDFNYPLVIKADGLAAGKGVIIAQNKEEAVTTLDIMMLEKKFGSSGDTVVLEEFLEGVETSVLAFVDGNTIVPMVSSTDHKKLLNGDCGPNTGGMGTFSPTRDFSDDLKNRIQIEVLDKSLKGFQKDGLDYKGVLFVGLMIKDDDIKVLEYNCRFGDPETQSVLMRMETDLSEIMMSVIENRLDKMDINYTDESSCTVILASEGYPESYEKGRIITGLDSLDEGIVVFHSGTKEVDGKILTNGGRVLGISSRGSSIEEASKRVYSNIEKIKFDGMQYRTDIGN